MEPGLDHAVRIVQTRFVQFEQEILVPGLETSRRLANEYPITATFASIFITLAFFPVASFVGFAVVVSSTVVFIALAGAFLVSTALVIAAAVILALTLSFLFLVSILLAIAVLSIFATVRLGQRLRASSDVKQGVVDWARETRDRFRWHKAPDYSRRSEVKDESRERGHSDEWQAVNGSHS